MAVEPPDKRKSNWAYFADSDETIEDWISIQAVHMQTFGDSVTEADDCWLEDLDGNIVIQGRTTTVALGGTGSQFLVFDPPVVSRGLVFRPDNNPANTRFTVIMV